jgi:hypothetical protein
MAIRKPTITTAGYSKELATALEPVKQSVEMITGARIGMSEIKGLPQGTTSSALIGKVNEIIARINVSGTAPLQRATTDSALDDVGVQPKTFDKAVESITESLATMEAELAEAKTLYLPLAGGTMTGTAASTTADGFRINVDKFGSIWRNDGSSTYFLLTNSGNATGLWNTLRPIYWNNSTGKVTMGHGLTVWGAISGTTVQATSDKRLKKNIRRKKASLEGLHAYKYQFRKGEDKAIHVGLLAQEVKEVLPEAVREDEAGFLALDYNAVVAVLVEEVNKLRAEVKVLKEGRK